ncbi:MAG: histidinol-phosphatase [Anaerolineae bacterium]|nr:histidinol-phosphatase [Anaerolineae bacterium]MDW8099892.1 histidinol-phosphatase [Anaerolineae bacterium]
MKTYRAELHVHTVLSPCAEIEMIPPLIVQKALDLGIELIAITDHNASANVQAVQRAAIGTTLTVLPGMELQTREEVHLLCLFDTLEQAESWQAFVDEHMPRLENNAELFGEQLVVDETGEFVRRETRLLLTSATLSLKEAVAGVTRLGGIAIPAHVDRKAFSLIANLGWIPPDLSIAAVEISRHLSPAEARQRFPQLGSYPLIQGGDAHRLGELLGANIFRLAAPTVAELILAFRNEDGRSLTFHSGALDNPEGQ